MSEKNKLVTPEEAMKGLADSINAEYGKLETDEEKQAFQDAMNEFARGMFYGDLPR